MMWYTVRGPRSCAASQGDGVPEVPQSSQPAGQNTPRQPCPALLSPAQQGPCQPCSFSSPLTARKPLRPSVFSLSQSSQVWISTNGWNLSLQHSACPSSPSYRAPHKVGFCLQSRSSGPGIPQSQSSTHLPALFLFLPLVNWGGGKAWILLSCFARSAVFVMSVCSLVQPSFLLLF